MTRRKKSRAELIKEARKSLAPGSKLVRCAGAIWEFNRCDKNGDFIGSDFLRGYAEQLSTENSEKMRQYFEKTR